MPGDTAGLVVWGPERLAQVRRLWAAASPGEALSAAELRRTLGEDPGLLLATGDGAGVVAAITRGEVGHVRLLAVRPEARRQGVGRRLLTAAEDWMRQRAARSLRFGAEVPRYLWPGIDSTWQPAVGLARDCGYEVSGRTVNLALGTQFNARPVGVDVRRIGPAGAGGPELRLRARELVDRNWPAWGVEFDLAADGGTLFVAVDPQRSDAMAFCAHSTLREGWIGPMGTSPEHRGRGVGAAVLAAVCADLRRRGYGSAQIAWVGPVPYFERLGATPARTFLALTRASE